MVNIFSIFKKCSTKKKVMKKKVIRYTKEDIRRLNAEIDLTNKTIRRLYTKSKVAMMNTDLRGVRFASRIETNPL